MKFFMSFFAVIILVSSCGTYEPKKDTSMKTSVADSGIEVVDPDFDLKNPGKIILYTVTQDKAEEELLTKISEKLNEKGVETVLDLGQSIEYGDETYRIRTKEKLMSVYYYLEIVAPGTKENEPVIAEIKADSIPKLIKILMGMVFGE